MPAAQAGGKAVTLKSRLTHAFNACSYAALQRRKVLKPLRAAAAKSKTATAAFDWLSQQRNITIAFDESLADTKTIGRYNRDGKRRWITLSPKYKEHKVEEQLDTLVHEIRHAWQDSHDVMLPYNLKFNMQHGMLQAFLWLCAEEADAHAHGMVAAAEAFGATIEQPLGYQAAYIDWFTGRLPGYLEGFITEWDDLIAGVEKKVSGNAADMQAFLADCRMATQGPVDQTALRALGQTITGVNYQTNGDFSVFVQDRLIHQAMAGPIADRQADLAALDARIAAFGTLAANQNTKTEPAGRRGRA